MAERKINRENNYALRKIPKEQLDKMTDDDIREMFREKHTDEERKEREKERDLQAIRELGLAKNSTLLLLALMQSSYHVLLSDLQGSSLYRRVQELACYDCKCHHENTCGDKGLEACRVEDPAPYWLMCSANLDTLDIYYRGRLIRGELPDPEYKPPRPDERW